jgi:hypothetical protein
MNAKWFNIALLLLMSGLLAALGLIASQMRPSVAPSTTKLERGAYMAEADFYQMSPDAHWSCQKAIENYAKHDLRWTESWLNRKFTDSVTSKYVHPDGLMLFYGDKAEAQNGFGGWVRVKYRCTYNPFTKEVVEAFAFPALN